MFRPTLLVVPLAVAACAMGGVAFAADGGSTPRASTPPIGTMHIVLKPQSSQPPKRVGDASIIVYRVFDRAGAKRLGRAQFVCVATDRRGGHEQCSGTIALPGGQIATQGDADNVALVGGSGAYAGARGTALGEDHADSVNVTLRFLR